jgi:S1-C subfamily serine protease
LQRGDVITAIDSQPIADAGALRRRVSLTTAGSTIQVSVQREQLTLTLPVTVASMPKRPAGPGRTVTEPAQRDSLGAALQLVRDGDGVALVVIGVQPGSRAARAGLQPGDRLVEVDSQAVTSAGSLSAASEDGALCLVERDGHNAFVWIDGV